MVFHKTQSLVAQSQARFRVVNCGRQWGKTTLACWEMFACAYSKGGRRIAYFATTYGQARDIAWTYLLGISKDVRVSVNETRLELKIKTQDGGESEIVLRGFESVETARGQQFDFIVLDEVAKMRNFKEGWEAVLLGTLAFRRGTALFISTPYGFNHFYDIYKQSDVSKDYESWTFSSFDNPYLPVDYLESIRQTVTTDFWSQEYLAEFKRFTGLVYSEFDITKHVEPFDLQGKTTPLFGMDFAVRGWTASLPCFIDTNGDFYFPDNYKKQGMTAEQHFEGINEMLNKYSKTQNYLGYADPAGFAKNQQKGDMIWSLADEYLELGLNLVQANNDVTSGINYVKQLFKNNKIHIHPQCTDLIDELQQYQWKAQTESQVGESDEPEKVRKFNDHLCFTADTKIEIPVGSILISSYSGKKDVYKFMGSKVTSNHPYLTPRGFVSLDSLRYSDKIVIWKNKLLTELSLEDTQVQTAVSLKTILFLLRRNYSAIRQNDHIGIYGRNITVRYLAVTKSIIEITTLLTTNYLTSNLYYIRTTIIDTTKKIFQLGVKILKRQLKEQVTGQKHQKVKNLENNLVKRIANIFHAIKLKETVTNVVKNMYQKQSLGNSATIIAKLKHLGKEDVYSHTTTSGFFLANNVVVTNCDAMRYALYSKSVAPEEDKPKPKWNGGELLTFKPWWEQQKKETNPNEDKFTPV